MRGGHNFLVITRFTACCYVKNTVPDVVLELLTKGFSSHVLSFSSVFFRFWATMGFSSSIFEGLFVGICEAFDDTASSSSRSKIYIKNITQPRTSYFDISNSK